MNARQLEEIRADLDHLFPEGGYELEWQEGKPLRLVLDKKIHENVRKFAEEVVRLHRVRFETRRARRRR